ncbi:heparan-alpha-glucosaminide N-acetyltransferase domain-containing protein [Kocuria rhizophila]|uniref:heparan-alpha-glucosaminide N-acetyltransferase domain-containing protein n=1 Tax=Kocuria rhizophila TaxID=72000 RepID=UPI001E45D390|nr:heparan-alpha-glucosaminide N-acetyltransferase domain-containing protein [Kocuria rhizophila]
MSTTRRGGTGDVATATDGAPRKRRLVGIDAARGLALIGLMAIHLLPAWNEQTGEASWSWRLFSGHSAALFALLAGVGLALGSGTRQPREGRALTADRVSVLVRALLIVTVGMTVNAAMPEDPPAYNILFYYGMFFILAIPFLHVRPKTLFIWAAGFGILSPLLMQRMLDVLPEWWYYNPTLPNVLSNPAGTLSQLLLTGNYPALPYMTYLLVGMGLGRLDLRAVRTQVRLVIVGVALTVLAQLVSAVLLYGLGGYSVLQEASRLSESTLDEILVWGTGSLPTDTGWWLAITTPHSNTPLAIATSLGLSLAVLGVFLLISQKIGDWLLPLSAMGSMTLTLYSAHLLALSLELHYDSPYLWYLVHVLVAAVFAAIWQRTLGQGPLERVVAYCAKGTRRLVAGQGGNANPGKTRNS